MNKFEGRILQQSSDLDDENRYEFTLTITKQPEKVQSFKATNGYIIRSVAQPHVCIDERVIFIKGINKNANSCKFRASYDEVNEIAAALKEFAKNLIKRSNGHRLTTIFK